MHKRNVWIRAKMGVGDARYEETHINGGTELLAGGQGVSVEVWNNH